MAIDSIEHLKAREQIERRASESAGCTEASIAHFVMAERYADLVWSLEEESWSDRSFPDAGCGLAGEA